MWMKNQEHRIVPSTVLSPDELLGSAGSLALLLTLTHSGLSRQALTVTQQTPPRPGGPV